MSSGKKGKKSKEKKLSLQDFLAKAAPQAGSGTTQVTIQKYCSSWADECEEDEDRKIETIQLPTAPRATRILEDNSIPQDPPFYARVSNLPFDLNEVDLDEFFLEHNIHIKEMKLARDETNDRLRGFGHIEFETREDLIDAIMLSDPTIRNRRLRIEVTSEPDMISGRTVRKRYDNYTPRDSANESTNWRDRKESNFESVDRDRGENRENRRNYQQRSNFQNRHDSNNNDDGGNWRLGDRPQDSPPERRRFPNERRNDRGGGGSGNGGSRYNDRREPRESLPEERPKLNIAPRTLPLPELNFPKEEELDRGTKKLSINGDKENHNDSGLAEEEEKEREREPPKPKPAPVPKENIFGQAKPVDTAAREREIEEKLDQERQERFRLEKEKKEKERDGHKSADEEPKKDVIVIKTENFRRQDESTNWRKRDEPPTNGSSLDNKNRGPQNRQIGRNDERPRPFNKDNRDRNYNNRGNDRDYRGGGGGMNRDRNMRDNQQRRDNVGPRRENEMRRDDREPREPREPRPRNHELPRFVENSGPNLQTSNLFAGLDDEVDAD